MIGALNPGRIPSSRILRHAETYPVYGIIHFSVNTFTDKEWGYGDEDPASFNPTDFDAEQIVLACKAGGLSGVVLVCKHHDGFCLWPTKTTRHNISASPFRNGKGDVVQEFTDACRRHGMGIGFYISPWDRNSALYGTPEYLDIYREQMREVYANYGSAFEVWFDGANGGEGFYGGAREIRKIDHTIYYDWQNTWKIVREMQPGACIFSDVGPEVRWPGNEKGQADEECFGSISLLPMEAGKDAAPGFMDYSMSAKGMPDGEFFIPPECDVPLRPGWFYHEAEDGMQKSSEQLCDIYLHSVGCGGFMNLGISPDRRGRLCDGDVKRLVEFGQVLKKYNGRPIAQSAVTELRPYEELTVRFEGIRQVNILDMREDLAGVGERVLGYHVDALKDGSWQPLLAGKAIGLRRIKELEVPVECRGVRLVLDESWENASARVSLACR